MGKLVLVTRPENQAQRFAEDVRRAGGYPVVEPLLHVVPLSPDFHSLPLPSLIVVTSPQAVLGQHFPSAWFGIPVLCVGDQTAESVKESGFMRATSVQGSSRDLIATLCVMERQTVCYLRGEDIKTDLAAALPQHLFSEIITYRAEGVPDLSSDVIRIFPHLHTVTLFSARAAQVLACLMKKHDLGRFSSSINLLSLAPQMLEYCHDYTWGGQFFAPHPDQAHMSALLREILEDNYD
ncbi:MAG: uroporphyrinogen-III synthase [Pseudobdellovibrionaceae bacterium]